MNIFQRLKQQRKHGLLAQSFLTRLEKLGLYLNIYTVYVEHLRDENPQFPDNKYRLEEIREDNMAEISKNFADPMRIWTATWRRRLAEGESGFALRHGDDVAGFSWAASSVCPSPIGKVLFKLDDGEAYLHDMVIAMKYRGAGLAPLLRFACYKELLRRNYSVAYSTSKYFNKPANRFKEKLDAKRRETRGEIMLFKKYRFDVLLKSHRSE